MVNKFIKMKKVILAIIIAFAASCNSGNKTETIQTNTDTLITDDKLEKVADSTEFQIDKLADSAKKMMDKAADKKEN